MSRLFKPSFAVGLIALGFFIGCILGSWPFALVVFRREEVTLKSLSPDDSLLVTIVELLPGWIDRNFEVRLASQHGESTTRIYRSPDEGTPVGSERVIWSKDGAKFLLVGRHVLVQEHAVLPNGEMLYLRYDVESDNIWCNATQQRRYPTFALEDLEKIEWYGSGLRF